MKRHDFDASRPGTRSLRKGPTLLERIWLEPFRVSAEGLTVYSVI